MSYEKVHEETCEERELQDIGLFERGLQALLDAFPNTPCCWETLGEEEPPENRAVESVS